jgi:hypothetical protein
VVRILHQPNKFGLFDGVERLIASNDIFGKQRVEYFLREITLQF